MNPAVICPLPCTFVCVLQWCPSSSRRTERQTDHMLCPSGTVTVTQTGRGWDDGDVNRADRTSECPVQWTCCVGLTSHSFNEILGRRTRWWQINRWVLTHHTTKYCREKFCLQWTYKCETPVCNRDTFLVLHMLQTHYFLDWQMTGTNFVSFNESFN